MDQKQDGIFIEGVKTHNLKNIDVFIPYHKITAVTGVSGSGKSSLVFHTLYAESQRRFLETIGTYERQFITSLPQGEFESMSSVPPALTLKQAHKPHPRSLVGTSSDVLDPLRQLFCQSMDPVCKDCGSPIFQHTLEHIESKLDPNTLYWLTLAFPSLEAKLCESFVYLGYSKAIINGEPWDLQDPFKGKIKEAYLVLDRIYPKDTHRLQNIMYQPFPYMEGRLHVWKDKVWDQPAEIFYLKSYCISCQKTAQVLEPKHLDPTSLLGTCSFCEGMGEVPYLDEKKILNSELSLNKGAVKVWQSKIFGSRTQKILQVIKNFVSLDTPYKDLPPAIKKWIFEGGTYEGVKYPGPSLEQFFKYLESKRYMPAPRILLSKYRSYKRCPECEGTRLNPAARKAVSQGRKYTELLENPLEDIETWLQDLPKFLQDLPIYEEVQNKIHVLKSLGLGSHHLLRMCRTLSGGEFQRVLLARVLGNGLSDTLYILDEPTLGLGKHEIPSLMECLKKMRDLGNTIVMVEHDITAMKEADHIIELGPLGGSLGGYLMPYQNPPVSSIREVFSEKANRSQKLKIPFKETCVLNDFSLRHCKNISLTIPLGMMTTLGGPSGSGKTTVIMEGILPGFLNKTLQVPTGFYESHELVAMDQKPIARRMNSVLATVLGIMDDLRKIFAKESQGRFQIKDFSFNGAGACPECQGYGLAECDLFFLGTVFVECSQCHGTRYHPKVLSVTWQGKNIHEWLTTSVKDAYPYFPDLKYATTLGLGHLPLGIPTSKISGGEGQRLKLVSLLNQKNKKLFCLVDEPTQGLSEKDVETLLKTFFELTRSGHTIFAVEHHPLFLEWSHQTILLGPESGAKGGKIVDISYLVENRGII